MPTLIILKNARLSVVTPNMSTALVSFYVGDNETVIFWLDSSSPVTKSEKVAVGRAEIDAAAANLHELFLRENINPERPEQSAGMEWLEPFEHKLLEPLKPWLATCKSLVVSPHGELHALPLHLLSPAGGAPLGTTHSITYVANLSLYALLLSRFSGAKKDFDVSSLCLATASLEDTEIIHENFALSPRSYATKTGGVFLEGVAATWKAFSVFAESAASIYLSCHGHFDEEDSLGSSLLLSDGKTLPSQVAGARSLSTLSVRDILDLRIRSRLVILDACMSGVQHFSPGDEPMGFSTAFLLSGANAVIASNWSVEQGRARFFMETLQDYWSTSGVTLGQAMREAYALTRSRYPHPYHWAGFSLIGNDRLLFN
jgi:CHAT domain-containing protein